MAIKWFTQLEAAQERCPIVVQGHLSNFKVTRLKKSSILTQIGRCRTVTPIWIYQWLWNDAQSLKLHRRCPIVFQGHASNFKVRQDKKSPILTRIEHFRTVTPVWIHRWLWNHAHSLMWYRRHALLFLRSHPWHFKVTQDKKHTQILTPIERFRTVTQVWLHRWIWNDA